MLITHSLTMYYSITGVLCRRGPTGSWLGSRLLTAHGDLAQEVSWG